MITYTETPGLCLWKVPQGLIVEALSTLFINKSVR